MERKERGEERLLTVMGRDNKPVSRLVWIETFRFARQVVRSNRYEARFVSGPGIDTRSNHRRVRLIEMRFDLETR